MVQDYCMTNVVKDALVFALIFFIQTVHLEEI